MLSQAIEILDIVLAFWHLSLWERRHYRSYTECEDTKSRRQVGGTFARDGLIQVKNFCDVPNEMETLWINSKDNGGHRVNSGKENRYEQGGDFLLHNDISLIVSLGVAQILMTHDTAADEQSMLRNRCN